MKENTDTLNSAVEVENEPEIIEENTVEQAPEQESENELEKTVQELNQKLSELNERCENEHEMLLRVAAEYDNFRKRTVIEKASSYTNGKTDAITALLPIADNLERALSCVADDDSELKKGVEMTLHQLEECFTSLGVEAIPAEPDTPFDPLLHNAVMHIDDENLGQNVISQCFLKGYKIGDRVIRHSMVQVAN